MEDAWRFVQQDAITGCGLLNGRCAMHGHGKEALEHFEWMCEGVHPVDITFLFLSACSHAGLVDECMCNIQ
jgi:hypothetical protein